MSGTTIYGSTAVCSPVGKFSTCIDAGSGNFSSSVQITGYSAPSSGVGLELFYTGGEARLFGYDRTNSVYKPMGFGTSGSQLYLPISGNTLIGTTTDAGYKLQVNGTGSFSTARSNFFEVPSGSGFNGFQIAADSFSAGFYIYDTTNSAYRLVITNSGVLRVANLGGTGTRTVLADASGNLSAPVSDISVKINIKTIGYGLNEIIKMNPVWFDFIDEYKNYGEDRQNGNIAQEMEAIIPEAVFTTPSTGKMGINYDQLHAVYIKAIQELNEKLVRNNIN
jgi:hypothetical protein